MRTMVVALVAVLSTAMPAAAQLSQEYAQWPGGPAGVLLTAAERSEYLALTDDGAAEAFVELFWARRDPDLETRRNELKVDFDARVIAADEQFAEGETRGALTDRGRVLLLLGVPSGHFMAGIGEYIADLYREQLPETTAAVDTTVQMHGVSFDVVAGKADIWEYQREQIPDGIDIGRAKSVSLAFFDTMGTGEFELVSTLRRCSTGIEVLEAMPATYVANPGLREPPVFPLIAGAAAATATQLGWLGTELWPEGASVVAHQGVAGEDDFPAWVVVVLPSGSSTADQVVGRLTLEDGTVSGTFQSAIKPIKPTGAAHGLVYELQLPAPVGTSTLELALVAAGQPVAVASVDVEIEEVAADATYISPIFGGAEVIEQGQFEAGEPYRFGGYHLLLRPDGHYEYDENLSYFCLLVRPGLGDDGNPDATVRVRLKYEGRQVSSTLAQPAELSIHVPPDVYMYGSQLPLNILPKGGSWVLRVTVEDTVSGTKRTSEVPFVMPDKADPAGDPHPS